MASRAQRRWLERELPHLVRAGVVPAEVAERLHSHYAAAPGRASAVPLFAVLGASLIGLGAILLLAANWEALSRPMRAATCFAVLLAAQSLAGFALLRRSGSAAWREATALGLALAAAAATALVAQTYQVQGDLRGFLATWILLSAALPYLFDARALAAFLLLGAGGWLGHARVEGDAPYAFWGFLALLAPYLASLASLRGQAGRRLRNAFLATVAAGVVAFGAVFGLRIAHPEVGVGLGSLVAAALYALGATARPGGAEPPFYATPVRGLASLASAGALLALCFVDAWGFVGAEWDGIGGAAGPVDHAGVAVLAVAAGGLAGRGALRFLGDGDWPRGLLAAWPLVVGVGVLGVRLGAPAAAAAALAGVWTLALAVGTALAGMAEADLRRANTGLLLLGVLVLTRFSDWNLSFTLRGVVFIAFGVGFLLLNLRLRGTGPAGPAGSATERRT